MIRGTVDDDGFNSLLFMKPSAAAAAAPAAPVPPAMVMTPSAAPAPVEPFGGSAPLAASATAAAAAGITSASGLPVPLPSLQVKANNSNVVLHVPITDPAGGLQTAALYDEHLGYPYPRGHSKGKEWNEEPHGPFCPFFGPPVRASAGHRKPSGPPRSVTDMSKQLAPPQRQQPPPGAAMYGPGGAPPPQMTMMMVQGQQPLIAGHQNMMMTTVIAPLQQQQQPLMHTPAVFGAASNDGRAVAAPAAAGEAQAHVDRELLPPNPIVKSLAEEPDAAAAISVAPAALPNALAALPARSAPPVAGGGGGGGRGSLGNRLAVDKLRRVANAAKASGGFAVAGDTAAASRAMQRSVSQAVSGVFKFENTSDDDEEMESIVAAAGAANSGGGAGHHKPKRDLLQSNPLGGGEGGGSGSAAGRSSHSSASSQQKPEDDFEL